jgi:hypothetical protein
MKSLFSVILLALIPSLFAQDEALMQDAVTKPVLSLRCKDMIKERDQKVKVQQRLNGLLLRNQGLIKKAPKAKNSLHSQLLANQIKIKNELYLMNLNIESTEENIIRSGCPGISRQ